MSPVEIIHAVMCPQCEDKDEFTVTIIQGDIFLRCIVCDHETKIGEAG